MTPVARISWHEHTKVDIIPDLQVSPVGFQNCFLSWVTWMILEACGVEFERAHSFAIFKDPIKDICNSRVDSRILWSSTSKAPTDYTSENSTASIVTD